jgi:hypothetical protein
VLTAELAVMQLPVPAAAAAAVVGVMQATVVVHSAPVSMATPAPVSMVTPAPLVMVTPAPLVMVTLLPPMLNRKV